MRALLFICVHLLWGGFVVHAQGVAVNQSLERAQICIDALDYECAKQELAKARAISQDLPPEESARLHELGAVTALSLGEQADAEEELRKLLELRPEYEPKQGSWPPNWLNVLQRVRRGMPDRSPPRIVAPKEVAPGYIGHDWNLRIQVLDPGGVAAATFFLRVDGEVKNISLATSDGEYWQCTVPGEWMKGEALTYWVEAYDRSGNGPSQYGSIDEPLSQKLGEKMFGVDQPMYKKWWFWTAVGGVVAAGGATLYLMSGAGESTPPIQTGNINVEIQWPSP